MQQRAEAFKKQRDSMQELQTSLAGIGSGDGKHMRIDGE